MKDYEKYFAENLKRMRLKSGLSQRKLGELVGFTDKSVSKWECAGGVPEISVLYKLADIFKVRIDDFFFEERVYFLGIDGGGTKTVMALADEDFNILRTDVSDGCNPMDIGMEESEIRLRNGIYRICGGIPSNRIHMFAGIAGGTSSENSTLLSEFFESFGFLSYESGSDNINIVSAGLGKRNGVSLIMGTGICAYCQKDGECRQFSGWGYLFDNGGSGYNIGRDGLSAHFESLHGIGDETLISREIEASRSDAQKLLGELYSGGKREIAGYSRAVYAAARHDDAIAISILKRNMSFAARVIEAASASLSERPVSVILAGGLTAEGDTLKYLYEALSEPEKYKIEVLSVQPVYGALIRARENSKKENGEAK